MTDDLIRAAVRAGQLTDPAAEKYLVGVSTERRNKIGRAWLTPIKPIVDPALAADGTLTFGNAAVAHGFAPTPRGYTAVWHSYDNDTGTATRIGETDATPAPLMRPGLVGAEPLPSREPSEPFFEPFLNLSPRLP